MGSLLRVPRWISGAILVCAACLVFAENSYANADGTYLITTTNISGYDCIVSCGSVTVTGDGTTAITFDVQITDSRFNIHGISDTIAFNLASTATNYTVAFDPVNAGFTNGAKWVYAPHIGDPVTAQYMPSGVNGSQGPYGKFSDSLTCDGALAGNLCGTKVEFRIANTDGAIQTLSPTDDTWFTVKLAAVDSNGATLNSVTGFSGAVVPGPLLGAGLPGLVAAFGGLLAMAWRRRRKIGRAPI